MKKIPILLFVLLFTGALGYLWHRENSKETALLRVNPAFGEYVEAFTSGIISTRSPILIRLKESFSDSAAAGMEVPGDWFQISPPVKGKLTWRDNRTIAFRPSEPLRQDQVFTVDFFLSKAVTVPDSLKTLRFRFRTMKQEIGVKVENHVAVSPARPGRETVTGTLTTADMAGNEEVESLFSASQDGSELPVSWTHDQNLNEHHFRIDSVKRVESPGKVTIAWDGSKIDADSKGSLDVEIPALGDFRVLSVTNLAGDMPCLAVQFSALIDPAQNLEGLFRVDRFNGLRYSVEDNILKIYFPSTEMKSVRLVLDPVIRSVAGEKLSRRFSGEVTLEDIRPNVRFVGDGIIMPSSNKMLLPFEAVNLNAVDVKVVQVYEKNILQFLQVNDLPGNSELARVGRIVLQKTIPLGGQVEKDKWIRYMFDLAEVMKPEPGAIYTVILHFKPSYATLACNAKGKGKSEERNLDYITDADAANEQNWGWYSGYQDDDFADGGWRNYKWEEREDPCKASYYYNKSVSRNVFSSDLGMIAKSGNDGNWHIFVTDLISARPLSSIPLEFYNFQLQPIAKGETNSDGMAVIPLKKVPFVVVARKGRQSGYLKLQDGKSLSLSMFDVSGQPVQKGLKGMIYGERGIWRPGDSIFLAFMLEDKTGKLPEHHPVVMTLLNPSGQVIQRMVRTNPVNGLYNFATRTPWDAPTGNWTAKVAVGNAEFTKIIKIEMVKPNRLKIKFDFNTDKLISEKIPAATLQASWLTGSVAKNLKARIQLTLSKSQTSFKSCPDYVFDNPTLGFSPENILVYEGKLGEDGQTKVQPSIHAENLAPGVLKASFETMVFEDGGDYSTDRFSIPFFPYNSYVGLKIPDNGQHDRVLYTDRKYPVSLINVDVNGKPLTKSVMKVEVYKLEWRWWWDDSEQGNADFISIRYQRPVDTATVTATNGKGVYDFMADRDNWGRYLIRVKDEISGHAAAKVIYVDWPDYFRMPGGEKQAAAMLTLTSDKTGYKVGDKVKLTIPTSPDGRALITIENGTSVLKSFWAPTQKGSTDIVFDATENMAPNCYAYVTIIQPHAQTVNDLPIRLYGVLPVPVENPGTHLKPVIKMAEELTPGKTASISVSESNGKAMSYTLAVVDEGLLDLTRFKTPEPWDIFYAREALGVKTWDLFDNVMGAISGELQRILSIGGDEDKISRDGLKANRFKPMVKFLGPFSLNKGQTKTHTFKMPEYVGSVRVMVVAGQDGSYGSAEKAVPVRKALMVLGTLPRVLGPGESVKLPVTVFSMDKKIKNVTVTLEADDFFTISGAERKSLTFSNPGDLLTSFDLKVADRTGIARVKIIASSGNDVSENEIEIGIRNPNQFVTNVAEATIMAGKQGQLAFAAPGIPGTNSGVLELSSVPAMNLESRLHYLITYPYGCIEQTVSSVFPQLYLGTLVELTDRERHETEMNISAAINLLKSFQLTNGGFGYWRGDNYPDDWGTSYAGHFLLEAEQQGFSLPVGWLSQWKEFQREKANSWAVNKSYRNDELAQAYRLYTLALARSPELGAMNRLLENGNLTLIATWQLAAAYQLAGKPEIALRLISKAPASVQAYTEMWGTYGSQLRDQAIILETMNLLNLKTKAAPLVKEIAAALCKNDWYSTQTVAYALMAVAKYAGHQSSPGITATLKADGLSDENVKTDKSVITRKLEVTPGKKQTVSLVNNGKGVLFARIITRGIPAQGDTIAYANNLKISVIYKSMDGKIISPIRMEQGTQFMAEVTIANPGMMGKYSRLALSEVFPSGWEIVNARLSDLAQSRAGSAEIESQDIRDDRVYTFFDLNPGRSKTISVMLMATWPGRYYQPPVSCSAMYDNTITARVPGRWVEVVNPLPR